MNMNEFTPLALRTESLKDSISVDLSSIVATLAMVVACNEVLDVVKKAVFYGKPYDADKLHNNLGTVIRAGSVIGFASTIGSFLTEQKEPQVVGQDFMRLLHGAVGMTTEAGELIEPLLKALLAEDLQDAIEKIDMVNIAEELGDSDWYKAIIHDVTGVTEDQVRQKVIAKLEKRYKDKQFNAEQAINRDLDGERKVLEA